MDSRRNTRHFFFYFCLDVNVAGCVQFPSTILVWFRGIFPGKCRSIWVVEIRNRIAQSSLSLLFVFVSLFDCLFVYIIDGELFVGTVADFSGMNPLIYREPLRTEQYDATNLNGKITTTIHFSFLFVIISSSSSSIIFHHTTIHQPLPSSTTIIFHYPPSSPLHHRTSPSIIFPLWFLHRWSISCTPGDSFTADHVPPMVPSPPTPTM